MSTLNFNVINQVNQLILTEAKAILTYIKANKINRGYYCSTSEITIVTDEGRLSTKLYLNTNDITVGTGPNSKSLFDLNIIYFSWPEGVIRELASFRKSVERQIDELNQYHSKILEESKINEEQAKALAGISLN